MKEDMRLDLEPYTRPRPKFRPCLGKPNGCEWRVSVSSDGFCEECREAFEKEMDDMLGAIDKDPP